MSKQIKKFNRKTKYGLAIVPNERVVSKIFLIRGKKVMLDRDLATLYGVTTGMLNQAVKRNINKVWNSKPRYPLSRAPNLRKEN